MCSLKFGRLEELHEATKNRRRLDEAYIKVSTGLATIDIIMNCTIDDASFQIRVEEIRCLDNINHLKVLEDSESEDDSITMGEQREWSGDDSAKAMMGFSSNLDNEVEGSVQGGFAGRPSPQPQGRKVAACTLELKKSARHNNEGVSIQMLAGLEAYNVGMTPSDAGPFQSGLNNLEEVDTCNITGPKETQVGLRALEPDTQSPPTTEPTLASLDLSQNPYHPSTNRECASPQIREVKGRGKK